MKNKHTQKYLENAVEKMAIGGNNTFAACFDNFLNLALSFFCNNCDERQMHLRKYMEENERFKQAYIDALNAFGDLAENYHDPMGDMFMGRVSHGQHGQFFTPESISLLMAEIIMDEKIHDGMTINDPACGSGRTLLMSLKHLRERHNVEPKLYANDLSMTCAKMTLLNFCVNSVDGEVTCGDTLKLDYENFTFFKIDKVRNLATGAVFSTYWQYTLADVEKVQEKRQKWFDWIAQYGWIKYRRFPEHYNAVTVDEDGNVNQIGETYGEKERITDEITAKQMIEEQTIDPLPTEVKVGENNQLMLF